MRQGHQLAWKTWAEKVVAIGLVGFREGVRESNVRQCLWETDAHSTEPRKPSLSRMTQITDGVLRLRKGCYCHSRENGFRVGETIICVEIE